VSYNTAMTKEQIEAVLEEVRTWPRQDQEELVEAAREIEARRRGIYSVTDEESKAIASGRESRLISESEAVEFWKSHGIE